MKVLLDLQVCPVDGGGIEQGGAATLSTVGGGGFGGKALKGMIPPRQVVPLLSWNVTVTRESISTGDRGWASEALYFLILDAM